MTETANKKIEVIRITQETLKRMQDRVGVEVPEPRRYHNDFVTQDGSRQFCWGYGDDNPLYCNAEYAKKTRWGDLIGAPGFSYTMGENDVAPLTLELKQRLKGDPLAGLGLYQAQMHLEWWAPLKEGDRCFLRKAQVGTKLTQGSRGGTSIHEVRGIFQRNQNGDPVAMRCGTFIGTERDSMGKKKEKKPAPEAEPYSDEELAAIDACYETERSTYRGPNTLYWEDVDVGSPLPKMVKGPLKITDMILWHMGWGLQMSPPGAFRLTYDIRKKIPALFPKDPMGIPDTVQRCHWQEDWAQSLGFPGPYDYGAQREVWLTHLISNWMGDDAWLWKLSVQHRKFNYIGDTTWLEGKVVDKKIDNGQYEVQLAVDCTNRVGDKSTFGTATVLLPSREAGPVNLPKPPASDLSDVIKYEVEKYKSENH